MLNNNSIDTWDVIAIVLYFILVLAAGLFAMCRAKRGTVSGYFLAGRSMAWLPVGASMFASNIGSEHFIGLAGSGAAAGMAVGAFEFNLTENRVEDVNEPAHSYSVAENFLGFHLNRALFLLQLLGWIFLPVYIANKVLTLPEYMSKRFGGQRIRIFLAVLSLILYIFTKISVNMYAGALFIKQTLGWNLYMSIIALLIMTAVCTVTGGLTAVIYTDTMQFFVMIIGATILSIKAFWEVGGYSGLQDKYMSAIPNKTLNDTKCGYPRPDSWTILRDPVESDMPWPGFILGQTPASIWYWCADQMMVQRALAAKSLSHAQGATLFTGYIKILPVFMVVLPGMISRVLYTDIVACAVPEECEKYCGNRVGCSNLAYPLLVMGLMPSGLRGVMLAVMLAALMSDLTSIFNSSSTLFTMDIWQQMRKSANSRELLLVGKIFVVLMVIISIIWIPIIVQMQGGQLYIYIQAIAAYLSPSIAAVYLLAVLWKRINEKAAFWSLTAGFAVGISRMVIDFSFPEPPCGEPDDRPDILKLHYMYFATFLFWQTILLGIIISLMTKPLDKSMLVRTTYWTRFEEQPPVETRTVDVIELTEANNFNETQQPFLKPDHYDKEVKINNGIHLKGEGDYETPEKSSPIWKRAYFFFCGYESKEKIAVQTKSMQSHLEELCSLQQDPKAKLFLNINLVIIILIGILLYTFFSFVDFR